MSFILTSSKTKKRISIPTGTIQVDVHFDAQGYIDLFQFQQVQFKFIKKIHPLLIIENFNSNRYNSSQLQPLQAQAKGVISIPTGTIQVNNAFFESLKTDISIPTGTIQVNRRFFIFQ